MTLGIMAAIAYGTLAIVGGIIGYRQAQSKMSLISGSVSGLLLWVAAALQLSAWQLSNVAIGQGLAIVVTVILVVVFIIRLRKTRKFMPAGLMIGAGVAALIAMLVG